MGNRVQWIMLRGTRILYMDARDLPESEYIDAQEDLKQEILKDRTSPPVLVQLSNKNTAMTPATTAKSKELAAATKAANLPDGPTAIVGLTGLQKAVAQLFGRGSRFFDTVDEAKEWLVKEQLARDQRRQQKT